MRATGRLARKKDDSPLDMLLWIESYLESVEVECGDQTPPAVHNVLIRLTSYLNEYKDARDTS